MSPTHPSKTYRAREQEEYELMLKRIKGQTEDTAGRSAESGYNQAIFDLLRDPVSLGVSGSNSNRGRQR